MIGQEDHFPDLGRDAWSAWDHALLVGDGKTKVGCAVRGMLPNGLERIYTGVNVQHKYRSHDIHAETNAIGSAVTAGCRAIHHVFIAAERSQFTPCGACMDWIFELGGADCPVSWQSTRGGMVFTLRAGDLMPHYPS